MVKEELNKEIIILLILGLVLVLAFYLYSVLDWQGGQYAKWDLHRYKAMAQAKWIADAKVSKPFCYRWLGPLLAGLMPFDTVKSFRILGWFSCAATAIACEHPARGDAFMYRSLLITCPPNNLLEQPFAGPWRRYSYLRHKCSV